MNITVSIDTFSKGMNAHHCFNRPLLSKKWTSLFQHTVSKGMNIIVSKDTFRNGMNITVSTDTFRNGMNITVS